MHLGISYVICFAIFLERSACEIKTLADAIDIEKILSSIEVLERESDINKKLIKELQTIVKRQANKIQKQESELISMRKTLFHQNKLITNQEKEISSLKDLFRFMPINSTFRSHRGPAKIPMPGVKQWGSETDQGRTINKDFKAHINKRQVSPDAIAFYAYLHNDLTNVPTGHIIKFGNIVTNFGNGYNSNDGIFVVPKSGLYLFHWRGMALPGKTMYAVLFVDGHGYSTIYADSTNHYNSDSETLLVHVDAGNHVWIEVGYGTSSLHAGYCTFSGVLLLAD